jgi:hypothetical protein
MDTHHHKGDVTARTISPERAFLFARLRIGVGAAAPIHEGPLAQRRCSFWVAGCGVIRAQGLAPHGLRVPEAARAPQGGVPSASGWIGPLDAFQARLHPRPGVARVSPRYYYGIATVYPRCISHVDAINMGDTPGIYRGYTVHTPCLKAWGCAGGDPGILNSEKGTRHRPPRR